MWRWVLLIFESRVFKVERKVCVNVWKKGVNLKYLRESKEGSVVRERIYNGES